MTHEGPPPAGGGSAIEGWVAKRTSQSCHRLPPGRLVVTSSPECPNCPRMLGCVPSGDSRGVLADCSPSQRVLAVRSSCCSTARVGIRSIGCFRRSTGRPSRRWGSPKGVLALSWDWEWGENQGVTNLDREPVTPEPSPVLTRWACEFPTFEAHQTLLCPQNYLEHDHIKQQPHPFP